MEWLAEKKIDKKLFRLIDPEQPLRHDDVFLPSVDFSILELMWVVFWALVFSTGVLGILFGLMESLQNSEPVLSSMIIIQTLLAAACFYGAQKSWRSLYWKLYRRNLLKTGRYRVGMFILEDAILLHLRSQICHIEKQWIRQLHIVYKGRGDSPELLLILNRNDHQQTNINLKILQLTHTAPELKKSISKWMNSGIWQIN